MTRPKSFGDIGLPLIGMRAIEIEGGTSVLKRVELVILDAATHEMPHEGLKSDHLKRRVKKMKIPLPARMWAHMHTRTHTRTHTYLIRRTKGIAKRFVQGDITSSDCWMGNSEDWYG